MPLAPPTGGQWMDTTFGLMGGGGPDFNHAKIGISISGSMTYAIFGDMNQQGAISGDAKTCKRSQNGRGGLFYVLNDAQLFLSLKELLTGPTAAQGE